MASSRDIDKLIKKIKGVDTSLMTEIRSNFDNEAGYSLLKKIYDYCHSHKAVYKKKEKRNLLKQLIEEGNVFAIRLMMMGTYSPDLNEPLSQQSILKARGHYVNADHSAPLFYAVQRGQFAVADYIMSYFKALLDEQPDAKLSTYYTCGNDRIDPLFLARRYLADANRSDQQKADCRLFIDNFFSLLPRKFVEKNLVIFSSGPRLVDFYTFVLDEQPRELVRLLKENAIPVAELRLSVQYLLLVSIKGALYELFDLLLMMAPDHIRFAQPIAGSDGDTLLQSCIRQNDAYFLFALLELNHANAMLSGEAEAPLNEAIVYNPVCRLLFKLYATNASLYLTLYDFIRKESERLKDMSDPLSFFRPSKLQGFNAILSEMDTPEKFFRRFISRADFSDLNEQLEGSELFEYAIQKIGLVDFSYMSGDKLVSTNLSNILGQNRLLPFSTPDTLDHLKREIKAKVLPR